MHQAWSEEHVPDASLLSDEELCVEVTKAICSYAREKELTNLMREAELRLGIHGLSKYADDREKQQIDPNEKEKGRLLLCVQNYARKHLGEATMPTVTIGAWVAGYIGEKDLSSCVETLYSAAKKLSEKDKSIEARELFLLAKCWKLLGGRDMEDPSIFEEYITLTEEVIEFYSKNNLLSDCRWMLYTLLGSYALAIGHYNNYCTNVLLKNQLLKSGHLCFDYLMGNSGTCIAQNIDYISFLEAAFEVRRRMLHSQHPDVIEMEKDMYRRNVSLMSVMNYNSDIQFINRLRHMCNFVKLYHGSESPQLAELHHIIRFNATDSGGFADDVWDMDLDIRHIKSNDDGSGYYALNLYGDIIASELMKEGRVDIKLVHEFESIIDNFHSEDPMRMIVFKAESYALLQKLGIKGYEAAFDRLLESYLNVWEKNISWNSVTIGKILASISNDVLGNFESSMKLLHATIQMEKSLAGEGSELFVCEYTDYGGLALGCYPLVPLCLDGSDDIERLFKDIRRTGASDVRQTLITKLTEGEYYLKKDDVDKALENFLYLVNYDDTLNIDKHAKANLCVLIMQCYYRKEMPDSAKYYAKAAQKEYGSDFVEDYSTFHNCKELAEMYMYLGEYDDAKYILESCLSLYDKAAIPRYDQLHMGLLTDLITLYMRFYDDMDACHRLAEKCMKETRSYKNALNPFAYMIFLQSYYNLLEVKEYVYFEVYAVVKEYIDTYYSMQQNIRSTVDVVCKYGLFGSECFVNLFSQFHKYKDVMKEAGMERIYQKNYQDVTDLITDFIIPHLLENKDVIKNQYAFYYPQLVHILATAYEYTGQDGEAEKYYKELCLQLRQDDPRELIYFYVNRDRVDEACLLCDRSESMVDSILSQIQTEEYVSIMYRMSFLECFFHAYYSGEKYDKALKVARGYKKLVQRFMSMNFDLYTEEERINFITRFSSGGQLLLMLLPYNDTLTKEVYDILLETKGLLLRASERIERSIQKSENRMLKDKFKLLNSYKSELLSLYQSQNIATFGNEDVMEIPDESLQKYKRNQLLERELTRIVSEHMDSIRYTTWEQVRNNLKVDEAAIEFLVSDSVFGALVLKKDFLEPRFVRILDNIPGEEFKEFFATTQYDDLVEALYVKDIYHLYDEIWHPLENAIGDAHVIYYSPVDVLHSISFAAIKVDEHTSLMDKYELRQLTTTRRLADRADNKKMVLGKNETARLYGAVCYDTDQIDIYNYLKKGKAVDTISGNKRAALIDFPFLDNSIHELDMVNETLTKAGVEVRTKEALDATEEEFRTMDGASPTLLHISTHGFCYTNYYQARQVPYLRKNINLSSMTMSGLALSNSLNTWNGFSNKESQTDNILSSSEVASLNLRKTKLVFLSACQSGLGRYSYEGVWGLQLGFKKAGVNALCVSLWNVNDKSSSDFAVHFYHNMTAGEMDIYNAFVQAQKQQRKQTPNPYDWGAFVVIDAPFSSK